MPNNIFNMLGVEKRELSYSNFLAWLFDPNINGRVGDEFLRRFLELDDIDYDLTKDTVEVDREVPKDQSEADIVIENDEFQLVIENKVKSREGEKQTERLFEDWSGSDKDEIFVFLTPEYREGPEYDEFKHITYTKIRDILKELDCSKYEERTRLMIEDYIETLEVNRMVEFEGFSEGSLEYVKIISNTSMKRKSWKKDVDNLFNHINKLLDEEDFIDDNWHISNKKDRLRLTKKNWDKGLSIKCILNENAISEGFVEFSIYALKDGVEDRKHKWKDFKEKCAELGKNTRDRSTKYTWVYKEDKYLFDELKKGSSNMPEKFKNEILEYIDEYSEIIDEVTS